MGLILITGLGIFCLIKGYRRRVVRDVLLALACLVALGGGFAQFYIGVHLSNDVIVGYLLGASAACCAIGLLVQNERRIKQ